MKTVAVANMKGGTAKTTTAAFLAHALDVDGREVLAVDSDPAGSLLRWSELGGWDLPVIGLATRQLHQRLPAIARDFALAVVDTPPLDDQAGVVYSALRAADVVVVPVGASTMELDRLAPILAAVEEVSPLRNVPPRVLVLLTRTVPHAVSTSSARQVIEAAGYEVLSAAVPRLERYAQAFGTVPALVPGDAYAVAAAEIVKGWTDGDE